MSKIPSAISLGVRRGGLEIRQFSRQRESVVFTLFFPINSFAVGILAKISPLDLKPTGGHFGEGEGAMRFLRFFVTTFFFTTGAFFTTGFLVGAAFLVAVTFGVGVGDLVALIACGVINVAAITSINKRLITVPLKFAD